MADLLKRLSLGFERKGADIPGTVEVPKELADAARSDADTVLRRLGSSAAGLSDREARERLARIGFNAIAREAQKSIAVQLFQRLRNPLNLLLLTLASVSLVMGDIEAAGLISAMVVLSVSLSFIQERRSSKAAEKLRAMVHTTATVVRRAAREAARSKRARQPLAGPSSPQSVTREVHIEMLCPGDVIHLSAGDLVPADVRFIAARDLFVNQAPLTGESLPVEKFAEADSDQRKDPFQLSNIGFMGSHVISGAAVAVVVLTGLRAYLGALSTIIAGERAETSFDKGINRFSILMIRFIVVMVPVVFLVNGLTKGNWVEALLFAMAVAVGLAPEMLPMIVTVNLAKGALAMSRKKVIVKRLHSIQNFGAMDVLCTDKTGTLTQDRIILKRHLDVHGNESQRVLEYAYLNSFYQSGLKNLLDVAVLKHADVHERLQAERDFRKIDEIPFDFARRRMSVVVEGRGRHMLICKGAVEEVFGVCSTGEAAGGRFDLDQTHLQQLRDVSRALNEDGFRVIAIAYKELPAAQASYHVGDESGLTLIGYIAFLDPPKETARRAIAELSDHGVRVMILTGDNEVITRKVCREVDLHVDRVLLGSEIEKLEDAQLAEIAESARVFAKLSPAQKTRVIKALQTKGHVVGFLGDGINDGAALKTADVGISVSNAVDVAKESADIILLRKSLTVLDEGVIEGRQVFANIIKYIRMGASSNFGNMFSVLGASAWLPFLPMLPIQVLTNNLLYDFSQTTIPTDRVDREYLEKPRRWEIGNIARFMLLIGPISSIFDYATYFTMYYLFAANTAEKASLFQTGWFVESLLSQTLIIHVIRTNRIPFVESAASPSLMLSTVIVCSIGIWLPFSPFAGALGFTHLPPLYWPLVGLILVTYLSLTHVIKTWFDRRFGLS